MNFGLPMMEFGDPDENFDDERGKSRMHLVIEKLNVAEDEKRSNSYLSDGSFGNSVDAIPPMANHIMCIPWGMQSKSAPWAHGAKYGEKRVLWMIRVRKQATPRLGYCYCELWDKSSIAKIAIKRGIPNTSNGRIAEEIKTGVLARNKEYIVSYRGNDFETRSIREVPVKNEKLATITEDDEEVARLRASASVADAKSDKGSLVAATPDVIFFSDIRSIKGQEGRESFV
ncbi:hypothetical protein ZIOFF_004509 [Zingiber officinale]|uniref:Uncharacterized protein n=1 Tax=Zingiber officinale TaxID=94328 RepID=A0A8J5I0N0_ZINOF|nr:hypothetical protein ZIOFF_004509 [Zingiber officinale]